MPGLSVSALPGTLLSRSVGWARKDCCSGTRGSTARKLRWCASRQSAIQARAEPARSGTETRLNLLTAIATQATKQAELAAEGLAKEVVRYTQPKKNDARSLEEALMRVPDLETIPSRVVRRGSNYEIREVEEYTVAEVDMEGRPFDSFSSGNAFNTLAAYLFGKNQKSEGMEMTTPVVLRQGQRMEMTTPVIQSRAPPKGEAMEMTTPVVTRQGGDRRNTWTMSFVLPAEDVRKGVPLPVDKAVRIIKVPKRTVAVLAFSGFVTDSEVERREAQLRAALAGDSGVRISEGATAEVAQYNPPFTLPWNRRNEIALEVELQVGEKTFYPKK